MHYNQYTQDAQETAVSTRTGPAVDHQKAVLSLSYTHATPLQHPPPSTHTLSLAGHLSLFFHIYTTAWHGTHKAVGARGVRRQTICLRVRESESESVWFVTD